MGASANETDRTRAVVQEFIARFAAGEPGSVAALFAERVEWQVAENPGVPWVKPRHTRADIEAHYAELAAHTVPEAAVATVEAVIVEGTDAVVTGRLGGVVRATGRAFRSPFVLRITVEGGEGGEITRMHIHEDTRAIADAADSFKTAGQGAA
jgi:uncharacterized protein